MIAGKLPAIKAACSDEDLSALLLDTAQKTFQIWRSIFNTAADTTTDSFSNNDGSGPSSTGTYGSWQRVANSPAPPPLEDLSPHTTNARLFPNLNYGAQSNHTGTASTSTPMDVNMGEETPRKISPNAAAYPVPVPDSFAFNAALAAPYRVIDQTAYQNASAGVAGPAWSPDMENMQFNGGFNMTYQPVIQNIGNQWSYPENNFRSYGGAP